MPGVFVLGIKTDQGERLRPQVSDNAEKEFPYLCRPLAAGIKRLDK